MSTLLGLLKDARALQCADARDKIYALLSIMDSSTAQQIRVDYRQTCFELITNVLPVVLQDVELHSGPTEAAKPAHTCMYTISSAIRVQSDDESYLAAIAARRQAPHRLASTDDVESGGPRARLEMRGWVGCRLEQGRLERTCDRVADGLHSERSRNTTVHILDAGRDLLAITSNSIRPGDWILCPEGAIRDTWPGLVLREVPDESFGIISVVVFNHRVTRNDNAATVFDRAWGEAEIATFTVHFDLEDFSTVHHLYQSFFGYERPMLQLPMGLDSGVRMITGIPCTKFESWPWALETRSEDELEQYFSVGVCHGVDSSYVEKEAVPPSEQG
ncbi:hypothetical protein B0A48_06044 [Cryoendolithus antarcticus]|uniref:Uncharacterized protein n=1 Tax=Cryoendolithus antarcticus TaxID=1507870 RepID=A0A1V8TCR0_9PEZI|nr:hypothetical protein B0A48_06044 [Cryoendolithus antarcticus]